MCSIPVKQFYFPFSQHTSHYNQRMTIAFFQRNASSRSVVVEVNGNGYKTPLEDLVKHPLQDQWTLWYLENDRTKTKWEDMQNRVTSFGTVEDFWSLHGHIVDPSRLGDGNDYSLFKGNIRPMWEDKANKHGGRWVLSFSRQHSRAELDEMWLDTVSDLTIQ